MVSPVYEKHLKQPKPIMTLRVAVAGHRPDPKKIPEENYPAIEKTLKEIFAAIETSLVKAHVDKNSSIFYQNSDKPILRVQSCLAEGIDRLAIPEPESITKTNFELAAILPFSKEDYAKDFTAEGKHEYERLLQIAGYGEAKGRVLELNATRSTENGEHYLSASQLLLDHSDLLVCVFDGGENSAYGTAATIKAAKERKIPVIIIDSHSPQQFHELKVSIPGKEQPESCSTSIIEELVANALLFTSVLSRHHRQQEKDLLTELEGRYSRWIAEAMLWQGKSKESENLCSINPPEFAYSGPINEIKHPIFFLQKAFSSIKTLFAPKSKREQKFAVWVSDHDVDPSDTKDPLISKEVIEVFQKPDVDHYYAGFLRADRLGSYYGHLHRSTFVLIYVMAAVALTSAGLLLMEAAHNYIWPLIALESLALVGILWLYWRDHKKEFHQRWLEYRALAELLRSLFYLSALGSQHSAKAIRSMEKVLAKDELSLGGPARSWMLIYIESFQRWVGFHSTRYDQPYLTLCHKLVATNWISGQIYYHTKNIAETELIAKALAKGANICFFATIAAVAIKVSVLLLEMGFHDHLSDGFEKLLTSTSTLMAFFALLLPILSTAAFSIRNHAEFDISSQRSKTTRMQLKELLAGLPKVDEKMLRSSLVTKCREVAEVTGKETAEWLDIYEVKETEPA